MRVVATTFIFNVETVTGLRFSIDKQRIAEYVVERKGRLSV